MKKTKNLILSEYQVNSGIDPVFIREINDKINSNEKDFYSAYHDLTSKKYIRRNKALYFTCDSLKKIVQLQSKQLGVLLSSLQERGTSNTGIVIELIKSGEIILNSAQESGNKTITNLSRELLILIHKQAYLKDPIFKSLIANKTEELKQELLTNGNEFQYTTEIENVIAKSNELYQLDALIGFHQNKSGLLSEINANTREGILLMNTVQEFTEKSIQNNKIQLIVVFSILTLIVVFFIIYFNLKDHLLLF
ncbi:MAG: hypothetical protein HC906_02905 [Bacteroidales bacterium]|nr:hypothetical protein [Bacteroidales bacterium]